MMWVVGVALALAVLIAPWWAIAVVYRQRRELQALRQRMERLEGFAGAPPLEAVPKPGDATAQGPPPEPIPIASALPPREEERGAAAGAGPTPTAPPAGPPPGPPAAAAPSPGAPERGGLEQLVGSVWLQNAGAVLVLLSVFFLILWGYTTGRFGPGVLVAAGVALGLALSWRGDRLARSVPALGHALIGTGLGIVYLALYLGHYTLHVLAPWPAFVLLGAVSFLTIGAGLRYQVQTIAALGVLGAFVPQLLAALLPLRGFSMTPYALLGYLAVVNVIVFALAARAGWSGLDFAALALTAVTWAAAIPGASWGWGVEIGLAALFTLLGLAPLPRLVRAAGAVRALDLLVLAAAPLGFIGATVPFLMRAQDLSVAFLLFALALVYLLAALWVDARRPERDLWLPLTGAAVLFLTVALQRALGTDSTPMAWCVEGALLVALGTRPRAGWLRLCGYVVAALGGIWTLGMLLAPATWSADRPPLLHPDAVRDLVCLATLLVVGGLLARRRERLSAAERVMPELWTGAGNLLLVLWSGREAAHLAVALEGGAGRLARGAEIAAPPQRLRVGAMAVALDGAAWMAQAAVLVGLGHRPGRGFLRACGYAVGVVGAMALLGGLLGRDGWSSDQLPVFHPVGMLELATLTLAVAVALSLAERREDLARLDRRAAEAWVAGASLLLLAWSAREADHFARAFAGVPGAAARVAPALAPEVLARVRTFGAAFTSAAWLVQALALLAFGWTRRSAFLRWAGLLLFGLTVLKFLLYDLQTVDVFWRFVTAIVVGVAMLAVSYAYQRRPRGGAEEPES
ncbi:MAG: hypothetical protein A2W00_09330 [Candidatus Eisenbacteria bacterium RBG_16_71_46]|nr:MAG: hypothetical protein A2W00_09330 [Candidatus Eisenbacteria bacterium RBG_16_71_46]